MTAYLHYYFKKKIPVIQELPEDKVENIPKSPFSEGKSRKKWNFNLDLWQFLNDWEFLNKRYLI